MPIPNPVVPFTAIDPSLDTHALEDRFIKIPAFTLFSIIVTPLNSALEVSAIWNP
ncbi:Uncharacterized protein dnl_59260 [Desulfonema limicola]|uniref:Uncharacterized protein n=1 Tax=Desulfonema limicola TaxID=45656 RepID=A0A975BE59_9BACT|nr:Uncharacterized protein dnl_59260 [Desulfonema limicola]